jgi:hypothetical protein
MNPQAIGVSSSFVLFFKGHVTMLHPCGQKMRVLNLRNPEGMQYLVAVKDMGLKSRSFRSETGGQMSGGSIGHDPKDRGS